MRILISSGGTKVPIDPVRDITNKSKGTFGAKIATEALKEGHEVIYLCAEDSKTPFCVTFDFFKDDFFFEPSDQLAGVHKFYTQHKDRYQEFRYRSYDDYAHMVELLVREKRPHVVVLAAAVSDYTAAYSTGKARSGEGLNIRLTPTAKIISKIKEWHPDCYLIGFKMLVEATDEQLIAEAWRSIQNNHCDMVVANDLRSLQRGQHEIILVEPTWYFNSPGEPPIISKHSHELAMAVMNKVKEYEEYLCDTSTSESPEE